MSDVDMKKFPIPAILLQADIGLNDTSSDFLPFSCDIFLMNNVVNIEINNDNNIY